MNITINTGGINIHDEENLQLQIFFNLHYVKNIYIFFLYQITTEVQRRKEYIFKS